MDTIEFKTNSGTLEIDRTGRFQMHNNPNYVSVRLKPDEIDRLIRFLQTRNENQGWKP